MDTGDLSLRTVAARWVLGELSSLVKLASWAGWCKGGLGSGGCPVRLMANEPDYPARPVMASIRAHVSVVVKYICLSCTNEIRSLDAIVEAERRWRRALPLSVRTGTGTPCPRQQSKYIYMNVQGETNSQIHGKSMPSSSEGWIGDHASESPAMLLSI